MYGIRLLFSIIGKDKSNLKFIKQANTTTSSQKYNKSITYESSKNSGSISFKILQYHYYTGEDEKETTNATTMSVPSMSTATVSNRDL